MVAAHGEDRWDAVLARAPEHVRGVILAPAMYPRAWFDELLAAACAELNVEREALLRAFGASAFDGLVQRYPALAARFGDSKVMLHGIGPLVQIEVIKLSPGEKPPRIVCDDVQDGSLQLILASMPGLCSMVEGLLDGLGDWFGDDIARTHRLCERRGSNHCELTLRIARRPGAVAKRPGSGVRAA